MKRAGEKGMRVTDMTRGDPLRLILFFAVPLFIGNVFQQVYTMLDTVVVGHFIGDSAISAIGATVSLYSLLLSLAISLNNGYAIVITQAFGAHDEGKLRRAIAGTILLNSGAAVLVTAVSLVFLHPLLRFIHTPPEVYAEAYRYIFVLCAGISATLAYNMFAGILRAVGNSRTPLYFLIISSLINVALDLLFVAVLRMGVMGAALATVIAQGISALLCGWKVLHAYRSIMPEKEDFGNCPSLLPALFSTGLAMALMICVVDLGTVIFERANNVLGPDVIAAHAAGNRIIIALMQPLTTIAAANATFVSQNFGAGQLERIRKTLKKIMGLEIMWGVIACALIYAWGAPLLRFITGTEDAGIIRNGVLLMRITLPFFPVLGMLFAFRTSMQAMGYKIAPVVSSVVELLIKGVCGPLLIAAFGYAGTSVTAPLSWVAMTAYLSLAYLHMRKKLYQNQ